MSTILEALRKARTEPPREAVEARLEILNPRSHDYLATVPSVAHPSDEVQALRRMVYAAGAVILVLVLVVLSLLLRRENASAPSAALSAEAGRGAAPRSLFARPAPLSASPVAQPAAGADPPLATPAQTAGGAAARRVHVTLTTPLVLPTEPPLPPPAASPPAETSAEESERVFIARAAALRAAITVAPDSRRRLRSESRPESVNDLEISGIVWDKTSPVAMVAGKVVRPGSTIKGARVVRINPDSVVFEVNGREVTVRQ